MKIQSDHSKDVGEAPTKHILVVEDEHVLANALKLKISKKGYTVSTAYNGQEALEVLEKKNIDLIVLDLVMPVMDGYKFLEKMKAKDKKIPVVIATNLGQEEDLNRAKSFGIERYYVKAETSIAQIVEIVDKVLS